MGLGDMTKRTIKASDMMGAPTILRHDGGSFYQSMFGGIVTIILVCLFAAIFVLKVNQLTTYQDISFSSGIKTIKTDNIPIDDFFFSIYGDWSSTLYWNKQFKDITSVFLIFANSTQQIWKQSNQQSKIVELVDCTNEMWTSRGIYGQQPQIYKDLCPNQAQIKQLVIQHRQTLELSYLRIHIDTPTQQSCKKANSPTCLIQAMNQNVQVQFKMINTIISESSQTPTTKYVEKIPFLVLTNSAFYSAQVQLTPYQITTDISFLPWTDSQEKKGLYVQNMRSMQLSTKKIHQKHIEIEVQMSNFEKIIDRKYGKFDDVLSYVGGLFGLLFFVVAFFLGSYNELKYEFLIAEANFKNQSLDEVNKITEKNWNFYNYIKFVVYDWLQFFGCPPKTWKQMKQFCQTRAEALYLLDTKYLLKRIRYLQSAVSVILPQNKQICLKLIEVPNMQKIRKERKTMETFEEYRKEKENQKRNGKELTEILVQQNIKKTIFHHATPSSKFIEVKSSQQQLQKWQEQLSDSQYIQNEHVKHQMQVALKEMLQKKDVDDEYNQIYDLMEDDFKGWSSLNPVLSNSKGQQGLGNGQSGGNTGKSKKNQRKKAESSYGKQPAQSQTSLNKMNSDNQDLVRQQYSRGQTVNNGKVSQTNQNGLTKLMNFFKGKENDSNKK